MTDIFLTREQHDEIFQHLFYVSSILMRAKVDTDKYDKEQEKFIVLDNNKTK